MGYKTLMNMLVVSKRLTLGVANITIMQSDY